jgi:CRP-like cAMP-binding protein
MFEPPAPERGDVANQDTNTNRLLSLLSPGDYEAISVRGSVVDLAKDTDLARAGDLIEYCWFPLSGLASVIASDSDGHEAEVGVIGFEGMVNGSVLMGSRRSAMRILVQIGGTGLRVDATTVISTVQASDECSKLFAAYHQALAVQCAYSALAYAQYPIEKRLARWVLMCADRVGDDHVDLTHEALSIMLGVRRAGVTVALNALVDRGAIVTRRGGLRVVDRTALLGLAGNGYGPAEAEYQLLVGRFPQPDRRNGDGNIRHQ